MKFWNMPSNTLEVENKLQEIANLSLSNQNKNLGLYPGKCGNLLFDCIYSQHKNYELSQESIQNLQMIVDEINYLPNATLANGKAGVNWFFSYLLNVNLIESGDYDSIVFDDKLMQQITLDYLKIGNWDLLHGGLGIAYSMLYYKIHDISFFTMIFALLNDTCQRNEITKIFPNYNVANGEFDDSEVNFGLAHGIPGILKFCIECYKQGVCRKEAFNLSVKIIDFLLLHINKNKDYSFFSTIFNAENKNIKSRLGWCYGDMGIAIILYQSGKVLNMPKISDFAVEVLTKAASRRSVEDTRIYDAGICHGSAGVGHIFNKMWHDTKNPVFKDAADFWIQKTLDFAYHENGPAGYKKYNPLDDTWQGDSSLLEGTTGIGLVLFSYLTGDFGWDYCLMLND